MRPAIGDVLLNAAQTLGVDVAPHLTDKPYVLGHTGTIGLLLVFLAQEAERAAETLSIDNTEMREIFRRAADNPLAADLKAALLRQANAPSRSLHLRVLSADNEALKALLIAVHQVVDDTPEPWARDIQVAIWTHLKASADRRALVLPAA